MNAVFVCLLLLPPLLAGCTTKSQARAEAKAAYLAGQQQSFANMQEARRTNIRILGSVRNPVVEWTDGLTLAQAIIAADYTLPRNPSEIVVIRQRERITVNLKEFLRGNDLPLELGDTIEIKP